MNIFLHRFEDKNYINKRNDFGESKLLEVNHICIHKDCVIFNDIVIPFGSKDILEKTTLVIDNILQEIIPTIQNPKNINKEIIVCGDNQSRKMLGRKLEDRLKREVKYK